MFALLFATPPSNGAFSERNSLREREKWLEPESNRRHEDFQSSALPTELSSRGREGILFANDGKASGFCKKDRNSFGGVNLIAE